MRQTVPPITDEEEAEIQRMIAEDPDNPEWTPEDFAQARPFAEVFPDLAESIRRSRGRPPADQPKQPVTLRLDPETVARFQAQGPDWRARMSEVLRRWPG